MLKNKLRRHLEQIYPDKELSCWFDPLDVREDSENNAVRVSFPHALFGQWFMSSVQPRFETHTRSLMQPMSFVYDCPPCRLRKEAKQTDRESGIGQADNTSDHASGFPIVPERYTFDSFLVNKKNDFPLAAAKETVAAADMPKYNPFVVYGQSGSGKTHLLGAMANAILKKHPELSLYYGDLNILYRDENTSFLPGSVFIIDNAQGIFSPAHRQENLIRTIDSLLTLNTLMLFAFDAHPATCADISQKLVARLSGGLLLELKRPDIDIRRQYIHQKNESLSMNIEKEQELILAQRYHDFRSIDGVLARVAAYKSTMRHDVDLRSILEKDEDQKTLTPALVIAITAKYFSLRPEELTGKSRDKKVAVARQAAMFLIRELLAAPLAQIGASFGGRDHSSIVYAIKKIKQIENSDKDTNKFLTELKQLCLSSRN